jgi:hypothetical protein
MLLLFLRCEGIWNNGDRSNETSISILQWTSRNFHIKDAKDAMGGNRGWIEEKGDKQFNGRRKW